MQFWPFLRILSLDLIILISFSVFCLSHEKEMKKVIAAFYLTILMLFLTIQIFFLWILRLHLTVLFFFLFFPPQKRKMSGFCHIDLMYSWLCYRALTLVYFFIFVWVCGSSSLRLCTPSSICGLHMCWMFILSPCALVSCLCWLLCCCV